MPERRTSDTRYTVSDSHRSQTFAIEERTTSNTRYAVGGTIVGDGRRDSDGVGVAVAPTGYLYLIRFVGKNVVVYTIHFKIICPKGGRCHEGKKECEKFFHIVCYFSVNYSFSKL